MSTDKISDKASSVEATSVSVTGQVERQAVKNKIRLSMISAALFGRALILFFKETVFFINIKKRYLTDPLASNPGLFLRKRTHHLERYLFSPDDYSLEFAREAAADIEDALNKDSAIAGPVESWARKILHEYRSGIKEKHSVFCPMIRNNAKRENPVISPDVLLDLIKQRRSRRSFLDINLTEDEKKVICTAAQYAPSSCNRQTIYLIFVENPEKKKFIASTIPGGFQFFSKAPCIVILTSEAGDYRYPDDRMVPFIDAAAAIENIYLICEAMGLGCCWGSYSSFGSVMKEKEVRKMLRIPRSHLIVGSLAIGRSEQKVCDIPRDLPEDRYWDDYYGNKK